MPSKKKKPTKQPAPKKRSASTVKRATKKTTKATKKAKKATKKTKKATKKTTKATKKTKKVTKATKKKAMPVKKSAPSRQKDTAPPSTRFGRSVNRGEVELSTLRRIAKSFAEAAPLLDDELVGEYDSILVEGDLHLDTCDCFRSKIGVLIVTGNLTVDGLLWTRYDPAPGVFVLGDVKAQRVLNAGTLGVGGDLTVSDALVGDYSDFSVEVRGTTRAAVFVPERHYFKLYKPPQFDAVISDNTRYHNRLVGAALLQAVRPSVLAKDIKSLSDEELEALGVNDIVSHRAVVQHVIAGKSWRR